MITLYVFFIFITTSSSAQTDDSATKQNQSSETPHKSSLSTSTQTESFPQDELQNLEKDLENKFDKTKNEKENKDSIKESMYNPIVPPSLEEIHTALSTDIVDISEALDTFIINERVIDGRNTTNVRILGSVATTEREGFSGNAAFRVRLRLPRLENMFQLEIDNLNNNLNLDSDTATNQTLQNTTFSQNASAGLSFFKDILGIQSKLSFRFIFKDAVPFANWRLSRRFVVNSKQNLNLISDVFGDTKNRTGQRTTVYYDISLDKKNLLRFFNEGTYRHEDHTYNTLNGVGLFHTVNDRTLLSYNASVSGLNPQGESHFYANTYDLSTTYRYRVYSQFVYVDLTPKVSFPKKYEFRSNWSLTFHLEIILGHI